MFPSVSQPEARRILVNSSPFEQRGSVYARLWSTMLVFGVGIAGCASAGASMLVKPPLQSQCQRLPIQGCSELVDGVILYVQGDKPGALEKIRLAKDKNSPAQLKPFAKALRSASALPGAEDYATAMNDIADLIDSSGGLGPKTDSAPPGVQHVGDNQPDEGSVSRTTITLAQPAPPVPDTALRALSATADFARLITQTVDLSTNDNRAPCKAAGQDALCVKVRQGAIVVTDVTIGRYCTDRLLLVATVSDSPGFGYRWQIEPGTNPLTGARLAIGGDEWLQVAIVPGKKGPSNSPECFVTWSGFRPWIVADYTGPNPGF